MEFDSRPSEAPSLLSTLKRYILRSKVRIEDISDRYDVWTSWGNEPTGSSYQWTHTRSGIIEPIWSSQKESAWLDGSLESLRLKDRRAPGMGTRLLVDKNDKRTYPLLDSYLISHFRPAGEASTHDISSHDDYTLHRILQGVPEGNIDIPPMHAFPMESNLDVMGGCELPATSEVSMIDLVLQWTLGRVATLVKS